MSGGYSNEGETKTQQYSNEENEKEKKEDS